MAMDIGALLSAGGGLADSVGANITSAVNAINRGIVGRGFQDAVIPTLNNDINHIRAQSGWFDDFGGNIYNQRREAFQQNMGGYQQAREGRGASATILRDNYQPAMQQMDEAVTYADQTINPLLDNARETYATAEQQYQDTKAKMAQATLDTVSTAREGLDRTLQLGEEALAGISDTVAAALTGVAGRLEGTAQDAETRAQQLEAAGDRAGAEQLRQAANFKMSQEVGNAANALNLEKSKLMTDARQKNMAMAQDANNTIVQAIANSAVNEAGANAASVRNLIDAVATGNQAASLAIQGPLATRIQRAAMGERFATNLAQATRMDMQDIENHAINVDNQISSNAQQYQNSVLTGIQTNLNALSYLLQGHGAVAQLLSGVQFQFTPGIGQAVNDYLQISAANQEPPGPNGWDHFSNATGAAATTALTLGMFS